MPDYKEIKVAKVFVVFLLWLILLAVSASSQVNQVYFKFQIKPGDDLSKLTKLMSIDNVKGDTVYAYSIAEDFENLRTLGYDYIILPNPGTLITPRMADSKEAMRDWDTYPTYSAYIDMMNLFEVNYPNLCEIINIGSSVNGRAILFAKLSANIDLEENEPEFMYSSTMHGDETAGYILMLRLIDYFLTNYGTDTQVTNILDNMEVWINPLANPDGTYASGNHTVFGATRYNANGIDLNRNFPDPEDGPYPHGQPWQLETIAMMNFFELHSFDMSANFHGGAEVVSYPWDTWSPRHADDNWFIQVSHEYADSAQNNSPSWYMDGFNDGITNGWDWYEVDGGRQDYLNYWKGCREITIELSNVKLIPESQLTAHWNYNRTAMLTYIEQVFYGIRGLVTDVSTSQPVAATVCVVGHDIDSSEIYTDPEVGDYHRMIESGIYNLRFTAPGYVTHTVNNVTAIDRNITVVDIQMQALPDEPILELSSYNIAPVFPGDTASMTIALVNNGAGNATGINTSLSSPDTLMEILQSVSTFPDINALGATGTSSSNYIFAVSPNCPLMHQADFRLDMNASGGYVDSLFFSITIGLNFESFETGNFSAFPWQVSGNQPWSVVSDEAFEGTYSARSGSINHNQTSIISIDYETTVAGTLSFYYKVSSENNYDYLKFYINSIEQDRWAGQVNWQQASYNILPGTNNFKWIYSKDGYVSSGSDCAWIDYIVFPSSGENLEITTSSLPDWTISMPYSQQLEANGGIGSVTWIDLYNDLVGTGLTLSSTGTISGIPLLSDSVNFTAQVEDSFNRTAIRGFDFYINPALEIIADTLPDGYVSLSYSYQLESSGGTGEINWTDLNNDLNGTGLSLSQSGILSGNPIELDTIVFIARAVDITGDSDEQQFSIIVNETFLSGDANGDGRVIGSDVTYLVNYIRGVNPPPQPYLAGDANGDCEILGSDVTYLVNYFTGTGDPPQIGNCRRTFVKVKATGKSN